MAGNAMTEAERQPILRTLSAFKYYKTYVSGRIDHALSSFKDIPKHHQDLLPEFIPHLKKIRDCIDHNYHIIRLMLDSECTDNLFENGAEMLNDDRALARALEEMDVQQVVQIFKHLFRDWSSDGKEERDACYKPIIDEIKQLYPESSFEAKEVRVLVPGAGLGRLAIEIAVLGYCCESNESSLFMLIALHFVLKKCTDTDMFTVYPWIHTFSNNEASENQIRPIHFPDVSPNMVLSPGLLSVVPGDFLEDYADKASWNCVATSYFIDTAHNIMAYIEKIFHILKPGGHWINLGPLHYHLEDVPNVQSIGIAYDVLRKAILKMGFKMLKENRSVRTTYIQDTASMMKNSYECVFFVCQKPPS